MMPGIHPDQLRLQKIFEELDRLSKVSDMPRRVELCQKALSMISREMQPELWAALQDDLGSSLAQTPTGSRAENIEQAIDHFKQALKVRTRQRYPKEWASTLNNLATAYRERIVGVRMQNIEDAIQYYQEVLEIRTPQTLPREWAQTHYNLAGAYFRRIHGERAKNIELAIQSAQQALQVYTRGNLSYYWAQTLNILGEAYRIRIHESRSKNIEKSIQYFQQATEVHTRQAFPEDWARVQNNLGNAYLARIQGKRVENIEQSIRHYRQALEVRTHHTYPELWAMTQYNLGDSYRYRIRGNQVENIQQAIYHLEQALEVRTREAFPEDWAQTQNNLGNTYLDHTRGELAENRIEQAIQHYKNALEIHTQRAFAEAWAQAQHNLGNAYAMRIVGNAEENIEQAIQHYEQALVVRSPDAFPEAWAQTQNNLAGAYAKRIRDDQAENLEQAIHHFELALEVRTQQAFPADWAEIQYNLAIAYHGRKKGDQKVNIQEAIYHYQQALKVYTWEAFPTHCRKTAQALGYLAFEEQLWEIAKDAYDKAFRAQEVLLQATFSRTSKQIELSEMQNLSPRAAFAHFKGGDFQRAVQVMEQGRAQQLRESLERRRQDLEKLPVLGFEHLLKAYLQATEEFNSLQSWGTSQNERPGNWMSQMEQALGKVQDAAASIRAEVGKDHPQYRYLLQALPFEAIQQQAAEKPLVYMSATSASGLALIVTGQTVEAIELPELSQKALHKQIWRPSDEEIERINTNLNRGKITLEDIRAVSGGYFSTYALWNLTPYLTNTSEELKIMLLNAWLEALNDTAQWLWKAFIGDLVHVLKKYSTSATFIPAGHLALLPLHAAWTEDPSKPTNRRYALDELNINYVPSAHALWQASQATQRPTDSLMAVDNPDGSLSFSEDEVQAAMDVFPHSKHLHRDHAVIETVKKEMQNAHVLHFSTHGNAGWQEEDQAQLKLADGHLTLPNLFELDLSQVRLAVLSACETGVPSLKLIDEMIGLPAGLMQAGVPGVIGSLWSVSDMSTAMLMARFYGLWRKDGHSPQVALRQAQIWLRDSTTIQKKQLFKDFEKRESIRMSPKVAQSLYKSIGWDDPERRVFESPYFWAAFTYTGV